MKKLHLSAAVQRINARGALLVFPINNRELPPSLWSEFFPNTKMVWDWNEDGDARVAGLWYLMKELSECSQVVYSKWYQGRATFFSRELYMAMLRLRPTQRHLSDAAQGILEVLENNSPFSTRELKRATDLQGRLNEPRYTAAMKELFTSLLIVGFGEVDDGAFPSLAVGATELLFNDLWRQAAEGTPAGAQGVIDRSMAPGSHFRKFWDRSAL